MNQKLKEDIVGILITLVFVLGFFVLTSFDPSIIGLSIEEYKTTATIITGCNNLTNANTEYELGNDIEMNWDNMGKMCINISASNITLDCKGYTLSANGTFHGKAITVGYSTALQNITIKNCHIKNFYYGLYVLRVNKSLIYNNTVECTPGFVGRKSCDRNYIFMVNYTNITNNNFTNLARCLSLQGDHSNTISWNNFTNCDKAIHLDTGVSHNKLNITYNTISGSGVGGIFQEEIDIDNVLIANNSFLYNDFAFQLLYFGDNLTIQNNRIVKYANQIDFRLMCEKGYTKCKNLKFENNTINDKEIKFFGGNNNVLNCPNNTIMNLATEDAGHIGLMMCNNITIQNYNFNASNGGLTLLYTNNSMIKNNNFYAYGGITLSHSDNNTIRDNHFYNSSASSVSVFVVSLYNNTDIRFINNTLNATVGGTAAMRIGGKRYVIENNTFNGYLHGIHNPIGYEPCCSCNITNNTFTNLGQWSINLDKLYNGTINNNNIKNCEKGILLYNAKDTTIANNTLSYVGNTLMDGVMGSFYVGVRTFFKQNIIENTYDPPALSLLFITRRRSYGNLNEMFKFNITFNYPNTTAVKSFKVNSITTRPKETVNYHIQSNDIRGNFTATRKGFYSLIVNVTDDYNNTFIRNFIYIIEPESKTERYYQRNISYEQYNIYPGKSWYISSYILSKEAPTSEEKLEKTNSRTCGDITFGWFLKEVPEVGSFVENVTNTIWYKSGPGSTVMSLVSVPSSSASGRPSTSLNFTNFTGIISGYTEEYWVMNYPKSWDWFKVGLSATLQVEFGWKTNATDPSYSDFYYKYGAYPAVKALSNTFINVLSATMPDDESEAKVVIDGKGWTNMTIVMPGDVEDVYYDSIQHNNTGKCNATIRGSTIYVDVAVASEHNISITVPTIVSEGGTSPNLMSSKTQMVEAGVDNFIEFNNPNIPLIGMNIILNKDASLSLEAKKISENQFENKLDDAYAYFSLKSNLDNSYFDYVAINFKIKKEYKNVKLYQLGDSWQELDVVKIYEDSKYKYYQTSVNSLGYFGITGEQIVEEEVFEYLATNEVKPIEIVEEKGNVIGGLLVLILFVLTFVYLMPYWKKL